MTLEIINVQQVMEYQDPSKIPHFLMYIVSINSNHCKIEKMM